MCFVINRMVTKELKKRDKIIIYKHVTKDFKGWYRRDKKYKLGKNSISPYERLRKNQTKAKRGIYVYHVKSVNYNHPSFIFLKGFVYGKDIICASNNHVAANVIYLDEEQEKLMVDRIKKLNPDIYDNYFKGAK